MGAHRGKALRWLCAVLCVVLASISVPSVKAQQTIDDTAGRDYFERGRAAFDEADYERALVYFRHAYRLSNRSELQYNIGVAADRLQRDEEALEAFEKYLDETENPAREAEVKRRVAALRQSIAERAATERALEEATVRVEVVEPVDDASDRAKLPMATIVGASALGAVGVAGVAAMSVALARDGSCAQERGGMCVAQHSATPWTWVYGGLGVAALAGSATWFVVSAKRTKNKRETAWSLTPTGVVVSGSF